MLWGLNFPQKIVIHACMAGSIWQELEIINNLPSVTFDKTWPFLEVYRDKLHHENKMSFDCYDPFHTQTGRRLGYKPPRTG